MKLYICICINHKKYFKNFKMNKNFMQINFKFPLPSIL